MDRNSSHFLNESRKEELYFSFSKCGNKINIFEKIVGTRYILTIEKYSTFFGSKAL